jgi:uncharacterized protein YqcC (DUF446 family)
MKVENMPERTPAGKTARGAAPHGALKGNVRRHLLKIKSEMRRTGLWDVKGLSSESRQNRGAFGMDSMSFEQWLRWVFVPNVEKLLKTGGPWPASSDVGVAAMRNFDGQDEHSGLVTLLQEFDALFSR